MSFLKNQNKALFGLFIITTLIMSFVLIKNDKLGIDENIQSIHIQSVHIQSVLSGVGFSGTEFKKSLLGLIKSDSSLDKKSNDDLIDDVFLDTLESFQLREDANSKETSEMLNAINKCFQIQISLPIAVHNFTVEDFIKAYQAEFNLQLEIDKWTVWKYRTKEGQNKMVRLEVDNSEDGRPHTVLNEFAIDNEGNPYAIEAEDDQRVISSDDAVSLILKDGETYFKERLVNLEFANGASAELLEQNSNLTRIKILKDKKSFFCSSISKSKDDCQCQSLEESID